MKADIRILKILDGCSFFKQLTYQVKTDISIPDPMNYPLHE